MTGKKILMVSMGQGGNAIATAFIDALLAECGVGLNGEPPADAALADALTVFCDRMPNGRLVPRRLMAATDVRSFTSAPNRYAGLYPDAAKLLEEPVKDGGPHLDVDVVWNSSTLSSETNFTWVDDGTPDFGAQNWPFGYQAPTIDTLADMVNERLDALNDDCVIWLFHALGGGYGSGGGSRLLELLCRGGGRVPVVSIPVLYSAKVSDTVWEPYGVLLAMDAILKYAHQVLVLHNDPLCACAYLTTPNKTVVQYPNLNAAAGTALAALASAMVWPDEQGRRMSVEDFHTKLWKAPTDAGTTWQDCVPDQMAGIEKLVSISLWHDACSAAESDAALAQRASQGKAGMLSSPCPGEWLKFLAVFHGDRGNQTSIQQALPGMEVGFSLNPGCGYRRIILAGAHTSTIAMMSQIKLEFDVLYNRKTFLHHYSHNGVDEIQFLEASSAITAAGDSFRLQTDSDPSEEDCCDG